MMQITPEQLLEEASRMALEIRLKDRMLEELSAENAELRKGLPSPASPPEAPVLETS